MDLDVPVSVLTRTSHEVLNPARERAAAWRNDSAAVSLSLLAPDVLADLAQASLDAGDKRFARVLSAVGKALAGDANVPIPSFPAAPTLLTEYLRADVSDGWVYRRDPSGHLVAWLVTDITIHHPQSANAGPMLCLSLLANGIGDKQLRAERTNVLFSPDQLTRRKPADVLLAAGIFRETAELKAEYEATLTTYQRHLTTGFAEQFRFTGAPVLTETWRTADIPRANRKVIHDVAPDQIPSFSQYAPSVLHPDGADRGDGPVPVRPVLRVFDLHTHDFLWVDVRDLTAYEYDTTLGSKIVLPADQRDLLNILTSDISTFVSDVIEGKSAGNVILCKGVPGVGKTLTAEVYSELIGRPLYAIHSGTLGLDAESVRQNLEQVFIRAKRWNAVLLLDEADVFVLERGADLQQNAVVAEFLRTLEYFDGLLFMTTNRADRIDDAILSRCAAIIDYEIPDAGGMRAVWQVQATNNGRALDGDLLDQLVVAFPRITPRDIKMLLRLALRVSASHGEPLTIDLFGRCAMFRGLHRADAA